MAVPAAEVTEVDDGLGPLVTLVIPDRMRRGMFWTPRHYLQNVSPLILNRITPVTDDTLPDAPPVVDGPPGPGVPKVTLVKRLGYQGPPVGNSETNEDVPVSEMEYPWDVYYGRLEGSQTNIVVKLSDMDNVPVRAVKGRTQRSAKSDIAEEYHRYAEALAAQGKSLPRYAGLFQRGSLYCAVFQDAGRSLEPEEMEDEAVKREVFDAFEEIRSTTGLTIRVEYPEWIFRGADGRIKFSTVHNMVRYTEEQYYEMAEKRAAAGLPPSGSKSAAEYLEKCHNGSLNLLKSALQT